MTQANSMPDRPDDRGAAQRREAIRRVLEAAAATRSYERSSWLLYLVAVVAVPLVVSALFVRMSAWHFILAGMAFVVIAPAMMALDQRNAKRRDRRALAADEAHAAYRLARPRSRPLA
jgi:hypothetical protein